MAVAQTAEETRSVVALLGGQAVFPRRIKDARDMQKTLRQGLPYAAFEAILEALGLKSQELAKVLGVASRTLARRKSRQQLSPIESDRLYRVAYVTGRAAAALGSLDNARTWLHRDNQALGVWIHGDDLHGSGGGKAGGYGYHKESAALEEALSAAGIRMSEGIGGRGDQAMFEALEVLARAVIKGKRKIFRVMAHG